MKKRKWVFLAHQYNKLNEIDDCPLIQSGWKPQDDYFYDESVLENFDDEYTQLHD